MGRTLRGSSEPRSFIFEAIFQSRRSLFAITVAAPEIAEKEVTSGAFRTCFPAGCIVEIDLPNSIIEQLQNGEKASVLMTANNNQSVKTDVSLKGFAPAYRRLLGLAAG